MWALALTDDGRRLEDELAAGCRRCEALVHMKRLDGDWNAKILPIWKKLSIFVSFHCSNGLWRLLLDSFM